ncbi:MAG: 2-hydroxyacid dehydrogenase [Candidatus Methanofastidiosia archaeon]
MNILVGGKFQKKEKEFIKNSIGPSFVCFLDELPPPKAIENASVVMVWSWQQVKPFINQIKDLKLVQSFFAGVERIEFDKIPESTVVASGSGSNSDAVAEHAFALILSLVKNLRYHQTFLEKGIFSQHLLTGELLKGKRIGIVGYGSIGKRIGKIARCFGMDILAINSSGKSDADFTGTLDKLHYLLKEADIVVISIAHNRYTHELIKSSEFDIMKKDAILVNVARGPIVSQKDLYAHLVKNPGFKAGIDVWWKYPKKGERWSQKYPFEILPNVQITPHSANTAKESRMKMIENTCKNVRKFVEGKKIKNIITKEDYLM